MAPAQYAPLPNPRSAPDDADRELDEAFGSEYDETDEQAHTESTPFISTTERRQPVSITTPGTYDFERDYDYTQPPPGSPPSPSAIARPNNWGNSNGELPVATVKPPAARTSFFKRIAGAVLPQHYQRVPTEPSSSSRALGGGIENDGVFANVTAKPGRGLQIEDEGGNVHMVPEDTQKDTPPSYNEAQADAVPGYWDRATVHAPINLDPNADMIVEDLPTGSIVLFCANMFISYFFNFVGFLLTYLLHTSHAAKYGSRAGLGLSLIQYGFYSRNRQNVESNDSEPMLYWNTTSGMLQAVEPQPHTPPSQLDPTLSQNGTVIDGGLPDGYDVSSRDWLAFLFMTLGWFLLLSSVVGFYRVKRWESSIRSASAASANPPSDEERQRETQLRRDFERAFLMPIYEEDDENAERRGGEGTPSPTEAELSLARNLRAAGFL